MSMFFHKLMKTEGIFFAILVFKKGGDPATALEGLPIIIEISFFIENNVQAQRMHTLNTVEDIFLLPNYYKSTIILPKVVQLHL